MTVAERRIEDESRGRLAFRMRGLGGALRSSFGAPLLVLAVGFVVSLSGASNRTMHLSVLACGYGLAATGLGFLYGTGGQLSIGHGALMGVGAYTGVLLADNAGLPFFLAIAIAMLLTMLAAGVVGAAGARVEGHYFLIVTFVFAAAMPSIANNLVSLTGGNEGKPVLRSPPTVGPLDFSRRSDWLYAATVLLAAAVLSVGLLRRSKLGYELMGLRENEVLARSFGIRTGWVRIVGFGISGAYAALGGSVLAYYERYLSPSQYSVPKGIDLVLMVLLGGGSTRLGPIVGAVIVVFLPEVLGLTPVQNEIALGTLLIAIVLAAPEGVASIPGLLREKWTFRRQSGSPVRADL